MVLKALAQAIATELKTFEETAERVKNVPTVIVASMTVELGKALLALTRRRQELERVQEKRRPEMLPNSSDYRFFPETAVPGAGPSISPAK